MYKLSLAFMAFFFLVSCAHNSFENRMKRMGYNTQDTALIKPYQKKYNDLLIDAFAYSNDFNDKQRGARNKIFNVYCKCYSSLGDKCDGLSSKGLKQSQKSFWAKHHGAKLALKNGSNLLMGNIDDVDRDYCN